MSDLKMMLDILRAHGDFGAVVNQIEGEFNRQFPQRMSINGSVKTMRDERIVRMFRSGQSINQIAGQIGMTGRQIRNIINR